MSTSRLEAFSDGVFAIAITLLVLDLRLPDDPHRSIAALLVERWPSYVAYVVSFAVIGIMWVNHHALFRRVERVDRPLLFQNLVLLLLVAALPFPTSVAAEGLRRGGYDAKIALFTYSITMLLSALAFSTLWMRIVSHPGILRVPLHPSQRRRAVQRFGLGTAVYAGACALAFVSPLATLLAHAGIAAYYSFEQLPSTETGTVRADPDAASSVD